MKNLEKLHETGLLESIDPFLIIIKFLDIKVPGKTNKLRKTVPDDMRIPLPINLTPPILATREQEPTPAFLTWVGISSEVHIHNMAKEAEAQKLLIMLRITIGSSPGYFPLNVV